MQRKTIVTAAAAAILTLGAIVWSAPSWSQPNAGAAAPAQGAQPGRGGGGRGGGGAPAAPAPTGKADIVRVSGGQIQGIEFGDVAVYRGVPYAAAPVGDLRWRAPQAVKTWTGVRDVSTYGAACTAPPMGSEDCLFLNVYKPADAKPGAKLPVMLWIHGGGFTGGSGSTYDGTPFVKQGVVYVSINYRMGRAGWFAHPAITKNAPAGEAVDNFGLMDQIASLKWVRDNIGAFGGDKNNVTVFGESAGGVSSMYLITVDAARGLFHKMIVESSFGLAPAFDPRQSERLGAEYFAKKNITGDFAATLAAMRRIPWADLQERGVVGDTQPIIDGKLIKADSGTVFSEGKEAKIPLLLGGNSYEASLWGTQNPAARLPKLGTLPAGYTSNGWDARRIVNEVVTDYFISEEDREMARWHQRYAPTYRYFFSYLTPSQRNAQSQGVGHGGEVNYVFARGLSDPQDQATSGAMVAYWTAFAKYGTPGQAGGPAWPKFEMKDEALMEFSSTGPVVRNHFYADRHDWVRDHRKMIGMTNDPGMAPYFNGNPAEEGPRNYLMSGAAR